MIKIAHESPKSIFKEVQKYTDYDYALVHLFEEDPEYLQQFRDAKEAGREIILDNSIFELEEAFDAEVCRMGIRIKTRLVYSSRCFRRCKEDCTANDRME